MVFPKHDIVKPWSHDWLIAVGPYPSLCSMKQPGVFLLHLEGMIVYRRSLPRNFVRFLYMNCPCLAYETNSSPLPAQKDRRLWCFVPTLTPLSPLPHFGEHFSPTVRPPTAVLSSTVYVPTREEGEIAGSFLEQRLVIEPY